VLDSCFFVDSSPSLLFVYLLPIGWIDHMYLVTFFGREFEVRKKRYVIRVHHILLDRSINSNVRFHIPFFSVIVFSRLFFKKYFLWNSIFILLFFIEVAPVVRIIDDPVVAVVVDEHDLHHHVVRCFYWYVDKNWIWFFQKKKIIVEMNDLRHQNANINVVVILHRIQIVVISVHHHVEIMGKQLNFYLNEEFILKF
jgi:hypothetical protein